MDKTCETMVFQHWTSGSRRQEYQWGKEEAQFHNGCRTLPGELLGSDQGGTHLAMPDSPPEQRGRDTTVFIAHRMWSHRGESAEREGSSEDQFLHTDQNMWMETEPKPEPPKSAEEA